MKWNENIEHITCKARKRLWILRRLRVLGIQNAFLWDVYTKEIRPLLEYACPVWNGNISRKNENELEKIQKQVLKLLLGPKYFSYTEACAEFKAGNLSTRRTKLCTKFAIKEMKKPKSVFMKYNKVNPRHRHHKHVIEPFARTKRYFGSSIPYLSRIINSITNIK